MYFVLVIVQECNRLRTFVERYLKLNGMFQLNLRDLKLQNISSKRRNFNVNRLSVINLLEFCFTVLFRLVISTSILYCLNKNNLQLKITLVEQDFNCRNVFPVVCIYCITLVLILFFLLCISVYSIFSIIFFLGVIMFIKCIMRKSNLLTDQLKSVIIVLFLIHILMRF